MAILRNIPTLIKVLGSISSLDRYIKGILEAREAGDPAKEREVIGEDIKIWANNVAREFDITIEVENPENIPEQDGCVYISNHQGYADIIALIVALDGRQLGFIAKDSLEKVPYLGKWIKLIRGLFIKRGDNREALKSMREGIELVKNGYNLAIFPEAAIHKGATDRKIQGDADILLFPDIHAGNIAYKFIVHTTEFKNGCILTGTKAPAILTSRSDSVDTKVNSIALASVVAEHIR